MVLVCIQCALRGVLLTLQVLDLVAPGIETSKRKAAYATYGTQIKQFSVLQNMLQIHSLRIDRLIAIFNEY